MTTATDIKNKYHARKATSFKEYQNLGGIGTEKMYDAYCRKNKEKAVKLQSILEDNGI